jgi:predicted  nucleic acid-binding Zn-ribbon protein
VVKRLTDGHGDRHGDPRHFAVGLRDGDGDADRHRDADRHTDTDTDRDEDAQTDADADADEEAAKEAGAQGHSPAGQHHGDRAAHVRAEHRRLALQDRQHGNRQPG